MTPQYETPLPDDSWLVGALELLESGAATAADLCAALQSPPNDDEDE